MAATFIRRHTAHASLYWLAPALLCLAAIALTLHALAATAPLSSWGPIIRGQPPDAVQALILTQVALPRLAMSWLVGAALGLAGLLFQQALRNPLADPATLGVSSGAYLAMAAATLYAPALLAWSAEAVALAGGIAACALVMAVARRSQFSTINIILAGLIVALFCGALAGALTILNHENLLSLFIWQTGSLAQNGWQKVRHAWPQFTVLAFCAGILLRPLALLSLEDARAISLGLHVSRARAAAVALGVALSAASVAVVGVIGFIGLMAPHLAHMLGARTLRSRMIAAPLLGMLLLWTTDQAVQAIGATAGTIPTGSACALVGAPILLWLLFRQRSGFGSRPGVMDALPLRRALRPRDALALCGLACVASAAIGLGLGRGLSGWTWLGDAGWQTMLDWRLPRVAAAGVAGAMLAMAGALLQRLTGNPLASPEVLGISSGASLGIIVVLLLTATLSTHAMLIAASAGALATLVAVVALTWRSEFSPERLLLAGAALSTLFSACAAFLLAGGDPRAVMLLTWMSGSTYRVTAGALVPGCLVLVLGCVGALAGRRWLAIMPLGAASSRALGVHVTFARLYFLLIIAVATASATMLVGPLSFVGLLAPHMVRSLGLSRPSAMLAGTLLAGSTIMMLADWLGRMVVFPWQIPAGLVAMLVGGPSFLWFLWRSK